MLQSACQESQDKEDEYNEGEEGGDGIDGIEEKNLLALPCLGWHR
jgi:hypothetical protein